MVDKGLRYLQRTCQSDQSPIFKLLFHPPVDPVVDLELIALDPVIYN
jgi:hypothetical protein